MALIGSISGSNSSTDVTGSLTVTGDIAVNGGDITTTAATFNLVTGSATTVNFAQNANSINIGKLTGNVIISSRVTSSSPVLLGDDVRIGGATTANILTDKTTVNLFNTVATTVNFAGAATALAIGAAGGSTTFAGNITGSNVQLSGDIAVNGGDLTSTAATFNLATNLATQLNVGGTTPTISVGTSTGTSTTGIATGTNTIAAAIKTVNIGTGTGAAATVNVNIGSSGSLGRTTLNNDVFLTTGNIIGSPGISGSNAMALISSGNIIAKLDTDASADGHKFIVRDWRDIEQFSVGENGNAEISGSLVVSGTTNMGVTVERMSHFQTTGSTISFDMTFNSIFYVNNPTADITANFTSLSAVSNNRIVTPTVILSQSATARTISTVQIDGTAQTIKWANGVTPTPTANKQEIFGFSLIRSGSNWNVLGQLSTYG